MLKEEIKVHLTKEQAEKENWGCEACGMKDALQSVGILPIDKSELFECRFCSHRETYLPNGKRKLKENFFKYA